MEAESRFRAMGSDVHLVVVGGPLSLLDEARELVEYLEARWSRFRPASEISLLNAASGRPLEVSPETLELILRALEGARVTGGRYDPTVLGDVVRAGYDRSFELLGEDTGPGHSPLHRGLDGVVVDEERSTVALPPGVGFDPGGIGKGYAADLLVRDLLAGAAGACANVGGDLRVAGRAPQECGWTVGLEHPTRRGTVAVIGLEHGAVATSTRTNRRWGPPNSPRHHLIDPATGLPAETGLLSSTVAAEAWQAEVLAKGAFLAGRREGLELLASAGAEGLLIDDKGRLWPTPGFGRFTNVSVSRQPVSDERLTLAMLGRDR